MDEDAELSVLKTQQQMLVGVQNLRFPLTHSSTTEGEEDDESRHSMGSNARARIAGVNSSAQQFPDSFATFDFLNEESDDGAGEDRASRSLRHKPGMQTSTSASVLPRSNSNTYAAMSSLMPPQQGSSSHLNAHFAAPKGLYGPSLVISHVSPRQQQSQNVAMPPQGPIGNQQLSPQAQVSVPAQAQAQAVASAVGPLGQLNVMPNPYAPSVPSPPGCNSRMSNSSHSSGCTCGPDMQGEITETQLVKLAVQILMEHGSVPVGKMGSLLHRAANNHALPAMLKEQYGGLKKFLMNHPNEFVLGSNHPYNPQVTLRGGVSEKMDMGAAKNSAAFQRRRLNGRDRRAVSDLDMLSVSSAASTMSMVHSPNLGSHLGTSPLSSSARTSPNVPSKDLALPANGVQYYAMPAAEAQSNVLRIPTNPSPYMAPAGPFAAAQPVASSGYLPMYYDHSNNSASLFSGTS